MNKLLAIICCAVCLIVASCHKDSKVIPQDFYFKADKNGADWGAIGYTYKIAGDSVGLAAFKPVGEEQIFIGIKFNGVGTYPLAVGQARFFTTIGRDVLTSDYRVDPANVNELVIKSYDTKTSIISGTWQLHLLKNSADPTVYVQLPFNSGTFRVKLPD